MALATTKMSSKGQVVIPEEIRKKLHLKEGVRFVVLHHDDTVVFKVISEPSPEEFNRMLGRIRAQVKEAGIKKADLTEAIREVRKRNKR